MSGLIITDPLSIAARHELTCHLRLLDIPLSCFTGEASPIPAYLPLPAFLRQASAAVLLGQPIPAEALLTHLFSPDPLAANVLRKYLFLRWSLQPYWRVPRRITRLEDGWLWGSDLLILPVSAEDIVDAPLPGGRWTELTGAVHSGRLRGMRGYNEMPVLVRENTLLPISMNGQSLAQTTDDDADRLTLHWFQPGEQAGCTLADGTRYRVRRTGGQIRIDADTSKPFHLILRQDGTETLVR